MKKKKISPLFQEGDPKIILVDEEGYNLDYKTNGIEYKGKGRYEMKYTNLGRSDKTV